MKTDYTAFDKPYWDYISQRWPEAFIDFNNYFQKQAKLITDEPLQIWDLKKARQLTMVINFSESVALDFISHYHASYSSGLIYEWFCKYNTMKNYGEAPKGTHDSKLIPTGLYDLIPDKYKAL